MKTKAMYRKCIFVGLTLCANALTAFGQQGDSSNSTDSKTSSSEANYLSVFTDFRAYKEETLADWKQVNKEVGMDVSNASAHGNHTTGEKMSAITTVQNVPSDKKEETTKTPSAVAPSSIVSDTRATVQTINRAEKKVKLKHGPLLKFDMPGMTMMYRVKDPVLLDQVKEGDEVGVTVEKIDGAFTITGFQP
jgi:Cu(I)/Ag(I) efflux system protein CusF